MITIFNKIIILIFLLSIGSCSFRKKPSIYGGKEYLDGLVSEIKPKWFSSVKRFSLDKRNGEPSTHMFFDANPKLNIESKTLNSVIITPAGSEHMMEIDPKSGKIFHSKSLCGTYDSDKKYNGAVKKPNFSVGFVPRYLDQISRPQEVIVFGGEDFIKRYYKTHAIDVRVIGAFVQRICPRGGCLDPKDWITRLILIAVQRGDRKFEEVETISQLKAEVDWEYTVAFLKNGFGKNKLGNKFYSAYQVGDFVDSLRAIKFIQKRSNFFDLNKMKATKKSCLELYDYAFKTLGHKSLLDLKNTSLESYKVKKKLKDELKSKGGKLVKPFSKRFKEFYDSYGADFTTCTKFVYTSNINHDSKRHWMFSHLEALFKLNSLGFSYSCSQERWGENSLIAEKQLLFSREKQFKNCSNSELGLALKQAPMILDDISFRGYESYKYITYDKHTHSKVYSWVRNSNKYFKCSKRRKTSFPRDVRWSR